MLLPDRVQAALRLLESLLQTAHFSLAFAELIELLERPQEILFVIFNQRFRPGLKSPNGFGWIFALSQCGLYRHFRAQV